MLVMFVLIYIAVSVLGMDRSPYLTLSENHIIGEITYTDGTTRKNLVPDQWRMSRGDVLRARIKLPSVKPYNNTSISFTVYNAEIDLGYDGETFYSYGHDLAAKNREIGNILVVAEVPDYAWGNWINLTLREQERSPSLQNSAYRLIPTVRHRTWDGVRSLFGPYGTRNSHRTGRSHIRYRKKEPDTDYVYRLRHFSSLLLVFWI